jgi:hypothetical protein
MKNHKPLILIAISLLVSILLFIQFKGSVSEDEYDVYSYIIDNEMVKSDVYFVNNQTLSTGDLGLSMEHFNTESIKPMADDLKAINSWTYTIENKFTSEGRVVLKDADLGILSFSRVSFNKTKDEAMLYYSYCGVNILKLKKINARWTTQQNIPIALAMC